MAGDPLAFLGDEITALKEQGLYFKMRVLQGRQEPLALIDGKQVVNLASNNYLGLTTHPKLVAAAVEATERYGVGSGAVRTIIGTMTLHEELEERLARFKHTEAAIVFQSGFTANTGVIPALMGEGDIIISDELNHASIIDGSRLTRAIRKVYRHKDMKDLDRLLGESREARRVMVVTDGVFSMDGDIAPLDQIVKVAEPYGAIVMVDDAHASGVLGRNGRGTVDRFGLHGRVHVQVGTLSKAIGSVGGYIAGSTALREWLVQRGRPFLFSTSHPPAVPAACIAALDVLEQEPELIERLWDNTRYFKAELGRLGFDTGASETPITPVIVGESGAAMRMSARLFEEGVFAQGIGYPTVARDRARVRTIVTATHTREHLDQALSAFAKVGKELSLIRG
ncbi:MAG: glycine C-acetyltransferase [Chloroflexota bacterium]